MITTWKIRYMYSMYGYRIPWYTKYPGAAPACDVYDEKEKAFTLA